MSCFPELFLLARLEPKSKDPLLEDSLSLLLPLLKELLSDCDRDIVSNMLWSFLDSSSIIESYRSDTRLLFRSCRSCYGLEELDGLLGSKFI